MDAKLRLEIRKIIKEYYDFYPDFFDPLYNPEVHGFIGFKDEEGLQQLGEEEIIGEGSSTFMDIPPSVGLIRNDYDSSKIWLHLFDFKEKKCFGHITLAQLSDRSYMVTTIAAEKGFGPLMLEIGMMGAYPSGICLDRVATSKEGVWKMFKKFADERPEIRKSYIKPSDMEYDNRHIDDDEKHFLYNVILFRHPSSWYSKVLERGARLSQDSGMDGKEITAICRQYFSNRYENG